MLIIYLKENDRNINEEREKRRERGRERERKRERTCRFASVAYVAVPFEIAFAALMAIIAYTIYLPLVLDCTRR